MINRLCLCYIGLELVDDRDSYVNKRVDLPGELIFEIFKLYYKKLMNDCGRFFKKYNNDDE
tara:strand:- start:9359 stop:9541 length:183 start_codon:yes stop_codon:yes gene_type:complete